MCPHEPDSSVRLKWWCPGCEVRREGGGGEVEAHPWQEAAEVVAVGLQLAGNQRCPGGLEHICTISPSRSLFTFFGHLATSLFVYLKAVSKLICHKLKKIERFYCEV